jgi:hypothetical protein
MASKKQPSKRSVSQNTSRWAALEFDERMYRDDFEAPGMEHDPL